MARKWTMALLLSLALCLLTAGALAADGPEGLGYGFNKTGLPIVDEEITVKVLYDRSAQHGDFEDYWFIDYVAEKTGIRLVFEQVESAAWNERLAVAFASDSYPDVFMHGLTAQQIAKYAAEGYLVNLAPLIKEYAPETIRLYNEYPELVKEIVGEKDAIYFMPSIV